MKKVIVCLTLVLSYTLVSAQKLRQTYNLWWADSTDRLEVRLCQTGIKIRNDSLFISVNSISNVIVIETEDSTTKYIPLAFIRERTKPKVTPNKPK